MSALAANRIPAAPIMRVAQAWLAEEATRLSDGTFEPFSLTVLAERVDVKRDTLEKILAGRMQTIDFDLADRLLCVMHATNLWQKDDELRAHYEATALVESAQKPERASGLRTCARRGCSNTFIPPKNAPWKRFCDANCKATAWKHGKHPPKTELRGKNRKLEEFVCRHGHERTAENTGTNWIGNRYCIPCHQAAQRKYDKKRRTQVPA